MDFILNNEFIKKYESLKPSFGFNGLGELVYLRTYSRIKEDGTNEKWYETIKRVVEGTYSIQKRHILNYGLGWDEDKAQESAQEMYDRMYNMKFLPPGRGLWAMGTDIIEKKQLFVALNNCAFVSTKDIANDLSKPFEFMIDFSMLGVGTGFDIKGALQIPITAPNLNDLNFTIPDTREGWIESLKLLLNAYFKGDKLPTFNYSLIRPKGTIIRTFGGKSAGPEPLIKLHEQIKQVLTKRIGNLMTGEDIVDIMNMIGQCVVAGNVRRTAQIAFGEADDNEYLKLKDYKWDEVSQMYRGTNTHRAEYGWASNNSIFAKLGMDYTNIAEQTAKNGEPGFIWLDNIQDYSRMNGTVDLKDYRALGTNPCGEQSLESYEMCTLVETFPTKHETTEDYLRTLKFAYLYAKTVTLGKTHWPETNRVQLRNRRIGTSISGIAQYIDQNGISKFKSLIERGYNVLSHYDAIYSDWFAVPRSIKITSIKPSGTISLLPGVTPGLHYPESNYYIRRMRISNNSDLVPYIEKANYPIEKDLNDPDNTIVVEVPVSIEGVRTINDVSMWEQLELASFIQQHWADNQVSCTITFKQHERKDIAKALNYFQYKLKAISFLPKLEKASYPQMPYEEITKEEYERRVKEIQSLEFNDVGTDSSPEMYCNNDTCQIM